MLCQVQKSFEAEGKNLRVGEVVDSTAWRWEKKLIDNRYLFPISVDTASRMSTVAEPIIVDGMVIPPITAQVLPKRGRGRPRKHF